MNSRTTIWRMAMWFLPNIIISKEAIVAVPDADTVHTNMKMSLPGLITISK